MGKAAQEKFKAYLERLTSAEVFHRSKRGLQFYRSLSHYVRSRIIKRLKEVDPEGLKIMHGKLCGLGNQYHKEKFKLPKDVLEKSMVAVEHAMDETVGVTKIRFMDAEGLKGLLAICLAAGYNKMEVAEFAKIGVEDLNSLITEEDVLRARKKIPNAVIHAADQKVMRDLLQGEVTEETARADMIASRRRKILLTAHAEDRETRREAEELEERREKHLKERFGVDRRKGAVIDVEAEEKEDGETEDREV